MTTEEMISALAWEGRQRGVSYGQLSASLKPGDELDIYSRYRKAKAQSEREAKARGEQRRRDRKAQGAEDSWPWDEWE